MAYRNGTYVAFDGQDTTTPYESDIQYFNLLKAWKSHSNDFKFSDSHKKTYSVKDSSQKDTLKRRLRERLNESKNFILILSNDTRNDREMLNYEIDIAIELGLPIIVCYTDFEKIQAPQKLSAYWPNSLANAICAGKVKCIHIPFKKLPILDAISQFSIHSKNTLTPLSYYSDNAYKEFGIS
ncbi:TIR domain-containing protein [Pasteurella sp. P03HT]